MAHRAHKARSHHIIDKLLFGAFALAFDILAILIGGIADRAHRGELLRRFFAQHRKFLLGGALQTV